MKKTSISLILILGLLSTPPAASDAGGKGIFNPVLLKISPGFVYNIDGKETKYAQELTIGGRIPLPSGDMNGYIRLIPEVGYSFIDTQNKKSNLFVVSLTPAAAFVEDFEIVEFGPTAAYLVGRHGPGGERMHAVRAGGRAAFFFSIIGIEATCEWHYLNAPEYTGGTDPSRSFRLMFSVDLAAATFFAFMLMIADGLSSIKP